MDHNSRITKDRQTEPTPTARGVSLRLGQAEATLLLIALFTLRHPHELAVVDQTPDRVFVDDAPFWLQSRINRRTGMHAAFVFQLNLIGLGSAVVAPDPPF